MGQDDVFSNGFLLAGHCTRYNPQDTARAIMEAAGLLLTALTLVASFAGSLCADRTMMQQYPATPYDSLALCNDNSTYNYYYRPGIGAGANT